MKITVGLKSTPLISLVLIGQSGKPSWFPRYIIISTEKAAEKDLSTFQISEKDHPMWVEWFGGHIEGYLVGWQSCFSIGRWKQEYLPFNNQWNSVFCLYILTRKRLMKNRSYEK